MNSESGERSLGEGCRPSVDRKGAQDSTRDKDGSSSSGTESKAMEDASALGRHYEAKHAAMSCSPDGQVTPPSGSSEGDEAMDTRGNSVRVPLHAE